MEFLDKTLKIFQSNLDPTSSVVSTKPCPQVAHPHVFGINPGVLSPAFHGQPDPMIYSPFHREFFPGFPWKWLLQSLAEDVPFAPLCSHFCSFHCANIGIFWLLLLLATKAKSGNIQNFAGAELRFNKLIN